MLILSRKSNQSVVIGGADGVQRMLKVTVLEIRGGSVRLGFEAGAEVLVHREEIWERVSAGAVSRVKTRPAEDRGSRRAADGNASHAAPCGAVLCRLLAQRIAQRTGGRVHALRIEIVGERVVVQGRAPSYHVRQLVCAAAMEVMSFTDAGPERVDVDIRVTPPPPAPGNGEARDET